MKIFNRFASALLLACGLATGAAQAQDLTPLRVQIFNGAYSSITVHVAEEMGFFKENGLQVEKVAAQSSSAAIAAMLGGSIDIVESAADLVLSNIDKGTELKYLMSNEIKNYATLVVAKGIELPHEKDGYPAVMQDLKGLRFGVNAIGASLHLAARMMLKDAGMTENDVQFVATGTGANTLAAWQAGTIDVQFTFAPVPELIEALGLGRTVLVAADQGPDLMRYQGLYAGWVTTQAFLDKNPEAADAFIRAMSSAIDWIRDPANHDQLFALAQKYSPVAMLPEGNDKVLDSMIRNYRRYWGYQISPETIAQWNDYALANGLIRNRHAFEDVVYKGAPVCTGECR